jgi:phosphoribosylformylglycinamidine cyclo-ligase
LIKHLNDNMQVKGFSHITGGGIVGNTKRILPGGLELKIEWETWEMPAVFKLIQQTGNISFEEMRYVFNLGIGLIAIISPGDENKIISLSNEINEHPVKIGEVI